MIKKMYVVMLCIMFAGVLSARSASITMSKRVWKLGERIEVKYSGTNASLRYKIGAFKRGTSNNSNPIKTRSFKNKTSGSVFMRLRADQGVKPGRYEFHLYKKDSNSILSKINLVLVSDETNPDPPVDPPTGSGNFTASSGTTDLNYADTTTFISEYSKLGYKNTAYQKQITKSKLTSMLANKNNMHFHSGHGSSGSILCTNGNLSVNNLAGKIQPTYSIYCICSSFASSVWGKSMGSNAKMVMGFNKTVTDGSCKSLATGFPAQLKNGQSYLMAWYKANAAISGHKDRWATYVKEGSKVVLYKAGGNIPRYEFEGEPIILSDQVSIDNILLNKWNKKTPFDGMYNIVIAKKIDEFEDIVRYPFPGRKMKMAKRTAKKIAEDNFNGSLEGIKFDSIIPIQKCDTENSCYVVAYDVYFVREYNGYEVKSNFMTDHISALITDGGIISTDTLWSEITPVDLIIPNDVMSVGEILSIASYDISNTIREPVIITKFKSVYGISENIYGQRILIPAYEFYGNNGERFVVDAFKGKLIR